MSTDANVLCISATFVLTVYLSFALFHEAIRIPRRVALAAASPGPAKPPIAATATRRPTTTRLGNPLAHRTSIPAAELVALSIVVGIGLIALRTLTHTLVARVKMWMISWSGIVGAVVQDIKTSMECSREGLDYSHFVFRAYLAFDLTLSYINYRQRTDYASPWTGHVAFIVFTYIASRVIWTICGWGPIHLCSLTELPTIMLTAARLRPRLATKPILTTSISLIRLALLITFLFPRTLSALPPLSAPTSALFFISLIIHGICIGRHVYYFLEKVTSHPWVDPWSRKAMVEAVLPPSLGIDVPALIAAAAVVASTPSPTKPAFQGIDQDQDRTELQSPPVTRPSSPVSPMARPPARSPSTPIIVSQPPTPPLHRRVQDLLPISSRPSRFGRGRATFFVDPDEPRGRQMDRRSTAPGRYRSDPVERGFLDLELPMREVLAFYYEPTSSGGGVEPLKKSLSRQSSISEKLGVQLMLAS